METTLYFKQGASDKVYKAIIDKVSDEGYNVQFQYGRRGGTMKMGSKTNAPVDYKKALELFNKLIKSKKAKGYTEGEAGTAYSLSEKENQVSGIYCQLLNFIPLHEVNRLCEDDDYCAQAKHDGERRLIERKGQTVYGVNKKGLYIALSSFITDAANSLSSQDFIIDGEDMGDVLVAFDLLRYDGHDIRHLPYKERYALLKEMIVLSNNDVVRVTETALTSSDKKQLFMKLNDANHEGIVFKRNDAVWSAGRPSSGGNQLKYKFYDECTVIVDKVNDGKRSVSYYIYDKTMKVALGNVTIPPNKLIPQAGAIIEVRYLYAYRNGCLYQPIFLKERTDCDITDCSISQLKYKAEGIAA